jgi:hypothetical protein
MENITNYRAMATVVSDFFDQNTPTGPNLAIMITLLTTVWTVRFFLSIIVNNPEITTPCNLTEGMIYEFRSLNLFTDEFLSSLYLDCLNPITPEVLRQLQSELFIGDSILLDSGLDIIVGMDSIPLDILASQILLLYV